MSRRTLNLDDTLYDYVQEVGVREHPQQVALREATRDHPWAGMQISPEQGQLMALVVKMIGARNAIEIGVFTGYSALTVALALPDDGRLLACDVSDEYTRHRQAVLGGRRHGAQDRPAARAGFANARFTPRRWRRRQLRLRVHRRRQDQL
jgi:predicted O-methyltransferase YrrM